MHAHIFMHCIATAYPPHYVPVLWIKKKGTSSTSSCTLCGCRCSALLLPLGCSWAGGTAGAAREAAAVIPQNRTCAGEKSGLEMVSMATDEQPLEKEMGEGI